MERELIWNNIIKELEKIGKDLNTVGKPNLTGEDYYKMQRIKIIIEGYKKTYSS